MASLQGPGRVFGRVTSLVSHSFAQQFTPATSFLPTSLFSTMRQPTISSAISSFSSPARPSISPALSSPAPKPSRPFSTSPTSQKRKAVVDQRDPKLKTLIYGLPGRSKVPAPLRMGRNRHLRHWTIHRAWNLYKRQERARYERELQRQWQGMNHACEELRNTSGPGTRPEGYLYRVAMEKKGVYGHHGVPIEYCRPQTESPARLAWNHDWKR